MEEFRTRLHELGWTYVPRAPLAAVHGLNCPPFGMDYSRKVHDQLVGVTRGGVPFMAVRYSHRRHQAAYERIVLLRLPHVLPPFFVSLPDHPRQGIEGVPVPNGAGLLMVAEDLDYGAAVVEAAQPAIMRWARRHPVDLAIDGDSLVSLGGPVPLDDLSAYVEELDDVAAALAAPSLRRFVGRKPAGLSFYGHPDWVYRARDDSIMAGADISREGSDHQALDVVDVPERGLWFTGFTHHYWARAGDSRHSYQVPVGQILLPFPFAVLANRWDGYGDPLAFFGWKDLDGYAFAGPDRALVTTVVTATRELLARVPLPPFAIDGARVHVRPDSVHPREYQRLAWAFAEFFSLVPDQVWHDLGLAGCPVPRSLR